MKCERCGKWAGAHATLPGQPTDHLCRCPFGSVGFGSPQAELARLQAEVVAMNDVCIQAEELSSELQSEAEGLRSLLARIRAWDVLDIPDSDGAFWKREIDAALAAPKEKPTI